jgi:hypothetical protein
MAAATPAPAAATTPKALASTESELPGLTITVQELKRGPNALTLKFVLKNQQNFLSMVSTLSDGKTFSDVGGVHLIDAANKKKYFVIRDAEGECVCSRNLGSMNAGSQTGVLWAQFPLPPDDVQKITVEVPHFPPLEDIPISR